MRHGLKLVGGLLSCLFALEIAVAGLPQSLGAEALPSLAPMLETTMPSVVNIATSGTVVERSPLFKDPFFQHFFNTPEMQRERRRTGLGSGVILDAEKGYIVTNHHVIEHADDILVTLSDGRKFSAQIVGVDPRADLAVIQIKAKKLSAIPLADSSKLRVGDFVVAIGNPFGLGQTVTSGIVSALGRSGLGIEDYEDFIQTDASINPGNSGGALVNLRGELIGINTAIVGPNGGSVGIGFAIAINMARDITAQLIEFGGVKRGYIGFHVQNISRELAQAFALEDHNGVVVTQVSKGSPAQRAGLRMGDVITGVNQVKVKDATDVRNQIGVSRVGQTLKIDLLRDNKTRRIEAEIIERSVPKRQGEDFVRQLSGAEFALIEEPRRELKGETVILLSAVDKNTAAASWGLNQGDIIRAINKIAVRDFEQMEAAIATSNRGMLLNIERDKRMLYILIR